MKTEGKIQSVSSQWLWANKMLSVVPLQDNGISEYERREELSWYEARPVNSIALCLHFVPDFSIAFSLVFGHVAIMLLSLSIHDLPLHLVSSL